jgi:hypothetical protein
LRGRPKAAQSLSPLDFFGQLHLEHEQAINRWASSQTVLDALLHMARGSFDAHASAQREGLPELGCHTGCATCCTLSVMASAFRPASVAPSLRKVGGAI